MKEIEIDGKSYEYDSAKLMSSELKAIQKYTGMTYVAWNEALGNQDIDAIDALVWLVRHRQGEPEPIGEYDYDVKALAIRDLDAQDEEPDPTLTTSAVPSQESTDATLEPSS